jgi:hypothetical protein
MNLIAAVVLVVAFTLLYTLFIRTKDIPPPEPVSPTAHLEERKAAIYENLRDLQFEYRVGKLSDADYQQTKVSLQKELATVMSEIDNVAPRRTASPSAPKPSRAPAPKPVPVTATVCPHCGAEFPAALKFCGECGKSMVVDSSGRETA